METPSNDFIIVIGRQYGSGGRRIAEAVAKTLGVPYYDKKLLSEAAESLGFASRIFAAADEKRPSILRSMLHLNYGAASANYVSGALSGETLYNAQSEVIRHIAEKGPCVIVGRTADYVMRDHPGLLSVFIHAPIDFRSRLILDRGETEDLDSAAEKARKIDRQRESYYNYYTGRNWGVSGNYHLSIDSSSVSFDDASEIIRMCLDRKLRK